MLICVVHFHNRECVIIYHMDGMKINFYGVRDAEIAEVLKVTGNKSGKAIVREINLEAEKVLS